MMPFRVVVLSVSGCVTFISPPVRWFSMAFFVSFPSLCTKGAHEKKRALLRT